MSIYIYIYVYLYVYVYRYRYIQIYIPYGLVNQRPRAFVPTLGLGPPKGVSIDRLSGVSASAGVCLIPWG